MSSLNNWNLKQLFLYFAVEWEEKTITTHQILWDKIIPRYKLKNEYKIHENIEYAMTDAKKTLRGRKVKFTVHAELMPIFGIITTVFSFFF